MKLALQTAAALLLSTTLAFAHDYTVGGLTIMHPMTFEKGEAVGAAGGYMTIRNGSDSDDTLLEVRVADVPRVELHLSETDANGVARMIKQDGIVVPAGGEATLAPGGLHVMFMGVAGDAFEEGETLNATLVFEKAGPVDVVFNVEARGADDHKAHDHSGHSHD